MTHDSAARLRDCEDVEAADAHDTRECKDLVWTCGRCSCASHFHREHVHGKQVLEGKRGMRVLGDSTFRSTPGGRAVRARGPDLWGGCPMGAGVPGV